MPDEVRPLGAPGVNPVDYTSVSVTQGKQAAGKVDFRDILKEKLRAVKFSGHALERLQKRNITLSPETLQKLSSAVQKAEDKGSRESLILMDNLALIVSIKNRTVITAVDGESIKENVFTNIDSAVIMR